MSHKLFLMNVPIKIFLMSLYLVRTNVLDAALTLIID